MVLTTHKRAKAAPEIEDDSQTVMVDSDKAQLSKTQAPKTRKLSQQGASKAKKVVPNEPGCSTSLVKGGAKASPAWAEPAVAQRIGTYKKIAAHFKEDENEVDFELDAPAGKHMSDGEVQTSGSQSGLDTEEEDVQMRSSQNSKCSTQSEDQRSRSWTRTCSCSHSHRSRSSSTPDWKRHRKKHKAQSYRRSVEQWLDKITLALAAFQQVVLGPDAHEKGKAVNSNLTGNVIVAGESETTIYKNAVDPSVVSKAVDDQVINCVQM